MQKLNKLRGGIYTYAFQQYKMMKKNAQTISDDSQKQLISSSSSSTSSSSVPATAPANIVDFEKYNNSMELEKVLPEHLYQVTLRVAQQFFNEHYEALQETVNRELKNDFMMQFRNEFTERSNHKALEEDLAILNESSSASAGPSHQKTVGWLQSLMDYVNSVVNWFSGLLTSPLMSSASAASFAAASSPASTSTSLIHGFVTALAILTVTSYCIHHILLSHGVPSSFVEKFDETMHDKIHLVITTNAEKLQDDL